MWPGFPEHANGTIGIFRLTGQYLLDFDQQSSRQPCLRPLVGISFTLGPRCFTCQIYLFRDMITLVVVRVVHVDAFVGAFQPYSRLRIDFFSSSWRQVRASMLLQDDICCQ